MANISEEKRMRIWENCTTVEGYDSSKYRKDTCGAWIAWNNYGKESDYGWEIDHTFPEALGGTDHSDNSRAMHWKNNRSKGDNSPNYIRKVVANGNKNIDDNTAFMCMKIL